MAAVAAMALLGASGASLGPSAARDRLTRWAASHERPLGCSLGRPEREVLTASAGDADLFHAVNLVGGGFAVVSSDDGSLVAFSGAGRFTETNAAPLWAMLLAGKGFGNAGGSSGPMPLSGSPSAPRIPTGVSVRRSAVSSTGLLTASTPSSIASESGISDLRVPPLVKSTWDQTSVGGKNVYNYYTPGNLYCGCVATAMAQIMRYHEHPKSSVAAKTKKCLYETVQTNLTMQGGLHDWSAMPLKPTSAITDEERQAIGKLTSDAGISIHMQYASKGSGAFSLMAAHAFTNTWGYAQAQYIDLENTGGEATDGYADTAKLENAILPNLDAGFPCLLGIATADDAGHAIVADGYGFVDGQRYIHLNMGWGGSSDCWYRFPVVAGSYSFAYFGDVIYNLFPTNTGNVVSGRITDTTGAAIPGATVAWQGKKFVSVSTQQNRGKPSVTVTNYAALAGTTVSSATGVYSIIVPNATVSITNLTVSFPKYRPATAGGIECVPSVSWRIAETLLDQDPEDCRYYNGTTPAIGNSWGNDVALTAYVIPKFGATSVIAPADGLVRLVVPTEAGASYVLQWAESLEGDVTWRDLRAFTGDGTTALLEVTKADVDFTATPAAFFRIALQ